jgi:cytochrome P450
MVLHGAAHRDPRQFDDPPTFEVAPSNVRRSSATRFIGEQQNG